jgi:VWFA-related protein
MDFRVSCCDVFIRLVSRTALCALSLLCFFAVAIAQEPAPTTPPTQSAPPPVSTPSPAAADKTQSPAPASPAVSQTPKPTDAKPSDAKTEVSMQDTGTTFKLRVNLVQVRVVVRDVKGTPVGNLRREDFQLFDQGKPQAITNFSLETPETRRERAEAAAKTQAQENDTPPDERVSLPERFVALVFDDIHMRMDDAVVVRVTAGRFIKQMTPSDRLAIFSTSGEVNQDFTSDRAVLERTLLKIIPHPLMGGGVTQCPDVSHYMGDQIENKHDTQALAVIAEEIVQCQYGGDETKLPVAMQMAEPAAMIALTAGDNENTYTYRHLEEALRTLASKPGERVLLLVSPGFLLTTETLEEMNIIDRANRANIVINTVDARGLYTPDLMGDISQPNADSIKTAGFKASYRVSAQFEQQFVLTDFANGTGGTFFHNSNDLDTGMKIAGAAPEVSYMLGFSPQNQKMDGRYHTIKVSLTNKQKFTVQARRGYYAPKKVDDPTEQAKAEIQEAIFSQDEIHDLPLDLQTQYFKSGAEGVHLSIVSRLEVKGMHFRKADGRNLDQLTLATAIFDENGNFVTGGEKVLEMRLLDTTYDRLSRTGLTVKSSFDVKPGKYLVRQVVRDSEGAQMAARNGAVAIPY